MRRRLFSIGSTAVYVHLATGIAILYWVLLGQWRLLAVSMICITLHELAHALIATCLGYPPLELEITPMGAMMRLDDEALIPTGKRLAMLCAGPCMTLMLCWIAILMTKAGMSSVGFGRMLFTCNLLMLVLNLVPALPLDGGRILYMVLGIWLTAEKTKQILRISGTVFGITLLLLNIWFSFTCGGLNLSMSITGCFLIYAASAGTTSAALAEMRMLMDRKIRMEQRGHLRCCWVAIGNRTSLRQAIGYLSPMQYTIFQLIQPGSMTMLEQIGEDRVIAEYLSDPAASCDSLLRQDQRL